MANAADGVVQHKRSRGAGGARTVLMWSDVLYGHVGTDEVFDSGVPSTE